MAYGTSKNDCEPSQYGAAPVGRLGSWGQTLRSQSVELSDGPCTTAIAERLDELANGDDDYWSFVDRDDREFVHSLFQYPAMMVPRLQRQLIEAFIDWDPVIRTVYDPFLGSGTVMTESMLQGLDFIGGDINPLAVLVAQAKSEMFDSDLLKAELRPILNRASDGQNSSRSVDFPNLQKWFEPHVIKGLNDLRTSIMACKYDTVRRFWWVALAETIRLASNSRTSTVKLHVRPASEIANRPDPLPLFERIAKRNLRVLRQQQILLHKRGFLDGSKYCGQVSLHIGDVRTTVWHKQADLMVTSPPYGDNHTTVTYGQASYLPLQWIDRADIEGLQSDECIENTHRIDTLSLGGSRSQKYERLEALLERSTNLRQAYDDLATAPRDCRSRVIAFYTDLDDRLGRIVGRVRAGGLLVWTTGDRTVGGVKIKMAPILQDLLGQRTDFVTTLCREIPQSRKRMPRRNASTVTMGGETILVVRRTEVET